MGYGDVWILGAGSSAEVEADSILKMGAPLVQDFRESALDLQSVLEGDERDAFGSVLKFWDIYGRSLNIEQLFGYVDSPALMRATQLRHPEQLPPDIRKKTHYLIAKVITERLGHRISSLHSKYVEQFVKTGGDTITFNWDITIDRAMIQEQARVDYGFPEHWGKQSGSPHSLLKLHGSLNWKYCRECNRVDYLDEKEKATESLLGRSRLTCPKDESHNPEILMIPPVLAKLTDEHSIMETVWRRAFEVLSRAKRVLIVGYSFPETDLQSRILINRGLTEARDLDVICVITKPKFGSERQRFEDRYVETLIHSGKRDKIRFEYQTFRDTVRTRKAGDLQL